MQVPEGGFTGEEFQPGDLVFVRYKQSGRICRVKDVGFVEVPQIDFVDGRWVRANQKKRHYHVVVRTAFNYDLEPAQSGATTSYAFHELIKVTPELVQSMIAKWGRILNAPGD